MLEYRNGSGSWVEIVTTPCNSAGSYSYTWPSVADVITTTARVRIRPVNIVYADIQTSPEFSIKTRLAVDKPVLNDDYIVYNPPYQASTYPISWTYSGSVSQVQLQYKSGAGAWTPIATVSAGSGGKGIYNWPVPNAINGSVYVRVLDADSGHPASVSPDSSQFRIKGKLIVDAPATNDVWAYQDNRTISWTAVGSTGNVKVEYSTDDGATWKTPAINDSAATVSGTNNSASWSVPDVVSSTCRVRVSTTDGWQNVSAVSGQFKIKGKLQIGYPAGGEVFTVENNPTITGTKSTAVTKIKIDVWYDYDGSWTPLVDDYNVGAGTTWSYPGWTVADKISPNTTTPSAKIRITDKTVWPAVALESVADNLKIKGSISVVEGSSSPLEYAEWLVGSSQNITWTAKGTVSPVHIYYSPNGVTWTRIADSFVGFTPGSGNKSWPWNPVRDEVSGEGYTGRIRVTASEDEQAVSGTSLGFKLRGQLTLNKPPDVIGEIFRVGQTKNIQWSSSAASIGTVKLEYIKDGSPYLITTTASVQGAGNSYPWVIPNAGMSDNPVMVRVTDASDSTVVSTGNNFYIKPELSVSSPGGASGEVYTVGQTIPITWTCAGTQPATVNIFYDKNDNNWVQIYANHSNATGTNTASPAWTITDSALAPAVRLRVRHPSDAAVSGTSTYTFKVKGDFTNIRLDPDPGADGARVGQNYAIKWDKVGPVAQVYLRYSNDDFNLVNKPITPGAVANSGNYAWTIPDDIGLSWKVRVIDASDSAVSNTMSAGFKIRGNFIINALTGPWRVDESWPVSWTTNGNISLIAIDYSKDGSAWTQLMTKDDNNPNGTTLVNVTVPDAITSTFRLRLRDRNDSTVWNPSNQIAVKGNFLVTQPSALNIWRVGENNEIKWETTGSISQVRLDYSVISGTDNYPYAITDSTPATYSVKAGNVCYGSYIWNNLPNIVGDYVRVRVKTVDTDWQNIDDDSVNFKVRGKLAVTYPNDSGITLTVGTKITITWNTTGTVNNVELRYSTDGGLSYPNLIATGIANTGKYPADGSGWTVPNNIDKECRIRVESLDHLTDDPDVNGESANNFTIRGGLNITQPTSSDVWSVGQTKTIIWDVIGSVNNVIVEYRKPNGVWATEDPIATIDCTTPTQYSVNWIVDDAISATAKVRIRPVLDRADIAESQPFKIKGFVAVTKPNTPAEILRVEDLYTIKWAISGTMNTVKLEWSTNGDLGPWNYINTVSAGVLGGEYNWTVSDTISSNVKIRVSDSDVPEATGVSPQVLIKGKLTLVEPKGSESYLPMIIGSTYGITWTTQGSISNVAIEYTTDYTPTGVTVWNNITNTVSVKGSNRYDWTLPLATQTTSNARVRVRNIADMSDIYPDLMSTSSFRIRGVLEVTAPISGTVFLVGQNVPISWTKSVGITQVKLEWYDVTGGGIWKDIGTPPIDAGGAQTYGSYLTWNAPDCISGDVRVRISDWADGSTIDESDKFRIKGSLILAFPSDSGIQLVRGTYPTISWTMAAGTIPWINLYYDVTSAFTAPVAINTGADRPYPGGGSRTYSNWEVPDNIQSQVWIKITDANYESGTWDISNNPFMIKGDIQNVQIDAPGGTCVFGEKRTITWTAIGTIPQVELRCTLNNGADGYPYVITNSAPSGVGNRTYEWTVGDTLPPLPGTSSQVRLKVSDARAEFKPYVSNYSGQFKIRGDITSVGSPNNGDIWLVGVTKDITWTATAPPIINFVKIQYSVDTPNHLIWDDIVASTANDGVFEWTIPNTVKLSGNARIRISDAADVSETKRDSTGEFRIRDRFDLTSPNGPSIYTCGQTNQPITWTSVSTEGKLINVKLEWSRDDFNTDIWTVPGADNIPNNGSFLWTIPANVINGNVKVRVYSLTDPPSGLDAGASAKSSIAFKIRGALEITNPNGNINWYVGDPKTIQWNTTGPIETVKVEYSLTDGEPYLYTITTSRPAGVGSGSCPWTVQDHYTDKFRVKITDVSSYTATDSALIVYNESAPYTTTAPNKIRSKINLDTWWDGGKTLVVDSTYNITWTSTGTIPNVLVEYTSNPPTYTTLAVVDCSAGPGTYNWPWTIPDNISNNVKVRVSDTRDSNVQDVSISNNYIKGSLIIGNPIGNEIWTIGSSYNITWTTHGTINKVNIYYSPNGDFIGNQKIIHENYTNTNNRSWQIPPDDVTYNYGAKIRVVNVADAAVLGESNGFKIRGAFTFDRPKTGTEVWQVNTNETISWTTTGVVKLGQLDKIDLLYSTDNFVSDINFIPTGVTNTDNTGSRLWGIPNTVVSDNVQIRIRDTRDPEVVSKTSPAFKVLAKLQVTNPLSTTTWTVGETYQIKWRCWGEVPTVAIKYSSDPLHPPASWKTITTTANSPPYDGSDEKIYNWTIPVSMPPEDITDNVIIRVEDTRYPGVVLGDSPEFRIKGALRLTAPVGGDSWEIDALITNDTPRNITWAVTSTKITSGNVNLYYSKTNFTTNEGEGLGMGIKVNGAAIPAAAGSYLWYVGWFNGNNIYRSDSVGTGVRIKIVSTVDNTVEYKTNGFNVTAYLKVTQPSVSADWTVKAGQTIVWTSLGEISNVVIEYDNYGTFMGTEHWIATVPNTGSYGPFNVPDDITASRSRTMKIRVRTPDGSAQDITGTSYKIKGAITNVYPNTAGQTFFVGTPQTISWTTTGNITYVRVSYSTDDGANWTTFSNGNNVVNNPNGNTALVVTIPDAITTTARIKVEDLKAWGLEGEITTPDPQVFGISQTFNIMGAIEVLRPTDNIHQGQFAWVVNSYEPIQWQMKGTIPQVTIELEGAGGQVISDTFTTTGTGTSWTQYSYNWQVLNKISTPNASWKIKIYDKRTGYVDLGAYDNSNNPFEIRGGLSVTSPVGGESWIVSNKYPITWTTNGTVDWVRLVYSKDDFATTKSMAGVLGDSTLVQNTTGGYEWTIPDDVTNSFNVKVRVYDNRDTRTPPWAKGDSNALKIRGEFTVTAPVADDAWKTHHATYQPNPYNITWGRKGAGTLTLVNLRYSKNNFTTDEGYGLGLGKPIATAVANSGTYPWQVPDDIAITSTVRVRVIDTNDSTISDTSGAFKIRGSFVVNQPAPAGGEEWKVFDSLYQTNTYEIRWDTAGSIGLVNIQYSTGSGWANIDTNYGNTGNGSTTKAWQVPDDISSNVLVRIVDANDTTVYRDSGNDGANKFRIRGDFYIHTPVLNNQLNVYDVLYNPQTSPITWTCIGTIPQVKIDYYSPNYKDGLWWHTIENVWATTRTGFYNWRVDNDITSGTSTYGAKIRLTDISHSPQISKESDGFMIRAKFNITSPVANDAWIVYDSNEYPNSYTISWTTAGTVNSVIIEYLKGGIPNNWFPIPGAAQTDNYPNLGNKTWQVPNDITADFSTKIRVIDNRDTVRDVSKDNESGGFKVRGKFTIKQPNGSEQWDVSDSKTISWTYCGTIPNVKLEYSQNGLWTDTLPIIDAVSNTGTYNWTIPDKITPATSTVKVRVSDTRDSTVYDVSDNGFKIRGKFKVTYPDAAELQLDVGTPYTITWTTDGTVPDVKLEYSIDNFVSAITSITASTAGVPLGGNLRGYVWTVPDDITSPDFKVRVRVSDVRDYDAKDDSDNPFKIRARFMVASPNAADTWTRGESRPISWTNTGYVPNVKIEYSTDNFASAITTVMPTLANGSGSGATYDWTVPDDITSPDFKVKVRISDTRDYDARDDSDNAIKIKGNFIVGTPNGSEQLKVGESYTITWTTIGTIPNVKLEYFYNSTWTTIAPSVANIGSYNWLVPDQITLPPSDYTVSVRVSDTRDPSVTLDTSDNPFKIKADITVVSPNGDEEFLVDTDYPITWTVVGTVPNVRLEYEIDRNTDSVIDPLTEVVTIATLANISGTNLYTWRVPDDISPGKVVKVKVVDTRDDNSLDKSDSGFRIKGWFDITSPVINDVYTVGQQQPITWTTFGTMPTAKLEYSLDNFTGVITTIDGAISNFVGANVYMWTVPDDITQDDRVRVRVTTVEPNDPAISDTSVGFKIKADIRVIAPDGGERWISNQTETISWAVTGTVPAVTIYYSVSPTFEEGIQLVISDTANTGSYLWQIPDRGGLKDKSRVRVCDSRDLTVYGQSPDFFRIDYYYITFNVLDAVTREPMRTMTYQDPTRSLTIYPVSSGIVVPYPYSTNHNSIFTKMGYIDTGVDNWDADNDKVFTISMEGSVVHSWQIPVDMKYDPASNTLFATSWFMKDGLMVPVFSANTGEKLLTNLRIDIYDEDANLIKTLESDNPNNDGVFTITWLDTNLQENTTYWAKAEITYSGAPYKSALTYNINIPKKLQAIQQSTAGLSTQMTEVLDNTSQAVTDTTQIKSDTESIRRQVGALGLVPEMAEQLAAVSENLSENMGDLVSMFDESVQTVAERGILSEILTRYTVVKSGDTVPVRYRVSGKGLTPVIDVYDNKSNAKVTGAWMTELPTPANAEGGIYEYKLTFQTGWGLGEFTVICSESSTRAMDSMVVTVIATSLEDIGSASSLMFSAATKSQDLKSTLDAMNSQLISIGSSVSAIPKTTAEGKIDSALLSQINDNVNSVVKKLKEFGGSQGYNFDTIVGTLTTVQEGSIKEVLNKLAKMDALQRISQQLLERTAQKYAIAVSYEWGSIKIKIIVVNKDQSSQRVPLKSYLPQELKPEDVLEKSDDDLEVKYDPEKQLCFAGFPTTPTDKSPLLNPGEMREFEITVRDVWVIPEEGEDGMMKKEQETGDLYKKLKQGTPAYLRGTELVKKIDETLTDIRLRQKSKNQIPVERYIQNFRDNKEKMVMVNSYINALKQLASPELAGSDPLSLTGLGNLLAGQKKGAGGEGDKTLGITAEKSWLVILIVVAFLGLLSVVFFFIWQSHLKKSRVSPELAEINPESVQMPEVGRSGEEQK
ncbi:MAG: hypothetical protein AB1599_02980 [Planctomycetota bacterium]